MEVLSKPRLMKAFVYSTIAGTGLAVGYATLSTSYPLCTAIGGCLLVTVGIIGALSSLRSPHEIRNATIEDIAETPELHYKVKCGECKEEHDQTLPIKSGRNLEVIAVEGIVKKSRNSIFDDRSKITITNGKKSIDCYVYDSPIIMENDKVIVTGYLRKIADTAPYIDVYHLDHMRSKKVKT